VKERKRRDFRIVLPLALLAAIGFFCSCGSDAVRIMRSRTGEKLYRHMTVRVIVPGQKDVTWRAKAKPGTGYGAEQLDAMLDHAAASVEKQYPSVDFRLVETGSK